MHPFASYRTAIRPLITLTIYFSLILGMCPRLGARTLTTTGPKPETTSPASAKAKKVARASDSPTLAMEPTGEQGSTKNFGRLPLSFEVNQGQHDSQVKYFSRAGGYDMFLTQTGAVFEMKNSPTTVSHPHFDKAVRPTANSETLRLTYVGANPSAQIVGMNELPGKVNYFIGNDQEKWRTDVPTYGRVKYSGIYPGVDLIYYDDKGSLEYDFVVNPGADPASIRLGFEQARSVRVEKNGDLVVQTATGEIRHKKPTVYQESGDARVAVDCYYAPLPGNQVAFRVGHYDVNRPLIIDPVVLVYSTYLDGSGGDGTETTGIALDSTGSVYVTGLANGGTFPVTVGAFKTPFPMVFITKLNPAGDAIVYSSYFGGSDLHAGQALSSSYDIAVDKDGSAYVTGLTQAEDFPVTASAFQKTFVHSAFDVFVTKLNPTGNALLYSTFLAGGSDCCGSSNTGTAVAVDAAGNAFVTGQTNSAQFPTTPNAFRRTLDFTADYFMAKVNTLGSGAGSLLYSTFLGGKPTAANTDIGVDAAGNVYVTGITHDATFPTTPNAYRRSLDEAYAGQFAGQHLFLSKFNPALSGVDSLVYSTFVGPARNSSMTVDQAGNVYLTGRVDYVDSFPRTPGAINVSPGGFSSFIAKMNPAASGAASLVYSGLVGNCAAQSVAIDSQNNVYLTGYTDSPNFPLKDPAQTALGGSFDTFAMKISLATSSLVYSTYLGGNGYDEGRGIAVDAGGNSYLTGATASSNFPMKNAIQPQQGVAAGHRSAFITKLGIAAPTMSVLISVPNTGGNTGDLSAQIVGAGFVSGATVRLRRAGSSDVIGTNVVVETGGVVVDATFDLTGQALGNWDVVVTNPGGDAATLPQGFTVEEGRAPQVWVDIFGRNAMRPQRAQTYQVMYGNRGNIDAVGVPLFIAGIPKNATLNLEFELGSPSQIEGDTPIDWNTVPVLIERAGDKVLPLMLPPVPPGYTGILRFTLTLPDVQTFQLSAWAGSEAMTANLPQALLSTKRGTLKTSNLDPRTRDCIVKAVALVLEEYVGHEISGFTACFDSQSAILVSMLSELVQQRARNATKPFPFTQMVVKMARMLLICTRLVLELTVYPRLILTVLKTIDVLMDIQELNDDCKHLWSPPGKKVLPVSVVASYDPNEKRGPLGAGGGQYISGEEPMRYGILFENKDTASAPAQEVVVTDQLDGNKLDFNTFGFGPIAFADKLVTPPPGLSEYNTDVDLRPQKNLLARINAKLDKTTGLVTWKFSSIDPATGQPIDDPLAGFLNPNKVVPEGEGNVLFTVDTKQGLATGTELRNKARIVFDTNAPIDTPEWLNTVDNSKPSSQTAALPPLQSNTSFEVKWGGTDTGSGVESYTVFVSESGGPFTPWLLGTPASKALFNGQPDRTYAFYTVAQDAAGNLEASAAGPDAVTTTPPIAVTIQDASYSVTESAGKFEVTVTRSGRSEPLTLAYKTSDGTASDRSDYTATAGTLRFAAGETSKTINVLVTDDVLSESNETFNLTLSDPTGGAGFGLNASAVLTITDNDQVSGVSPVRLGPSFSGAFFVRQHYLDFLNREPDQSGLGFWTDQINSCGSDQSCIELRRINVSAAFYLSIEFQQTGYLVERIYKAGYGDASGSSTLGGAHQLAVPIVRANEFLSDTQEIGKGVVVNVGDWQQQLENNKQSFTAEFVQRSRFTTAYPLTMTAAQFVDKLNLNAGNPLSQSERDQLVTDLSAGVKTRAQVLRAVAEDSDLLSAESNRAFVLMQYFGYLRRNPNDPQDNDYTGYDFWLRKLNEFNGNFIKADMVKAFLDSTEYGSRFGQ